MRNATFVSFLILLAFSMSLSVAHAERGSGSNGRDHTQDMTHNSDDDGALDQGHGDVDSFGNSVDDSFDSSDDDGTLDQGRGDFDAAGNVIDDSSNSSDDDGTPDQGSGDIDSASSDDEIVRTIRAWFKQVFSWWF